MYYANAILRCFTFFCLIIITTITTIIIGIYKKKIVFIRYGGGEKTQILFYFSPLLFVGFSNLGG